MVPEWIKRYFMGCALLHTKRCKDVRCKFDIKQLKIEVIDDETIKILKWCAYSSPARYDEVVELSLEEIDEYKKSLKR